MNLVAKKGFEMNATISIIIPSLNSIAYFKECLESVLNQTLKNIEIVCVDAGSTDGTVELINEYRVKDDRIKLVLSEKKSYGYQINLGFRVATGKYVAIVESDDVIVPDMYSKLLAVAEKNNLQVVKSDFYVLTSTEKKQNLEYRKITEIETSYGRLINPQKDRRLAFWAFGINPPGIYLKSFILENKIILNETPGASFQDNGLWFQIFSHAERVWFYNEALYKVRRDNPNSSVKSKEKVFCICEEYDYIREFIERQKNDDKELASLCAYFRFGNYLWNIKRIDQKFRKEFVRRFSSDFCKIRDLGEIDKRFFTPEQLSVLHEVIENPDEFYLKQVIFSELNEENKKLKKEVFILKNSYAFRIGRMILWLPRKIREIIK